MRYSILIGVAEPEPRAEEPKLNCLLEPDPKLRIAVAAPAPFYLSKTWRNVIEKNQMQKRFFKNYLGYNFNPIWVQHQSL